MKQRTRIPAGNTRLTPPSFLRPALAGLAALVLGFCPLTASATTLGAACTTANEGILGFAGNSLVCQGGFWKVNVFNDLAGHMVAIGTGTVSASIGLNSTAVGWSALRVNSAVGNTAVGSSALYNNTTGVNNSAFGNVALFNNIGGGANSAFGSSALSFNTTGNNNSAFGHQSLYANITGTGNVAIGYAALYANFGDANTAVGHQSLYANTGGTDNTAVGYDALRFNATGINNTAVGHQSLYSNVSGNTNTAVGADALLTVTTSDNTAVGFGALEIASTGSLNTALGFRAGNLITTGSNNTAIGWGAQVPTATASNQVRIGDTNITYAGIKVAWTITSDRRVKEDIKDSDLGLDFIQKLRPVSYRLKKGNERLDYGFIAQQVEQALDGRVTNMVTKIDDEMKTYQLRYNDLIAPVVRAIQELVAKFDAFTVGQQEINRQQLEENKKQQEINQKLTAALAQLTADIHARDGADEQPKPVPKNQGF